MKQYAKGILSLAFVICLATTSYAQHDIAWNQDVDSANAQAEKEGKLVLLNFSGSDWCANCIRLDKVLFQSEEFAAFAQDEFVLLNADFPARSKNKLSKEQTAKNEALAEKYNKKGVFPTVVLLSHDGKVIGRLSNPQDSASEYMRELQSLIE